MSVNGGFVFISILTAVYKYKNALVDINAVTLAVVSEWNKCSRFLIYFKDDPRNIGKVYFHIYHDIIGYLGH